MVLMKENLSVLFAGIWYRQKEEMKKNCDKPPKGGMSYIYCFVSISTKLFCNAPLPQKISSCISSSSARKSYQEPDFVVWFVFEAFTSTISTIIIIIIANCPSNEQIK